MQPEQTADMSEKYAEHLLGSISTKFDALERRDRFKTALITFCVFTLIAAGAVIYFQAQALRASKEVAECRARVYAQTFDDVIVALTDGLKAEREHALERINQRPPLVKQYDECAD